MGTKKTFANQMISGLFQKDCAFGYYQKIHKLREDPLKEVLEAPV